MNLTSFIVKKAAPVPRPETFEKYLFIGPHPDDIEIGAGATIARLTSEGKQVSFLICMDGRYGLEHAPEGMWRASGSWEPRRCTACLRPGSKGNDKGVQKCLY